jgi:soluble lytic murein transglycosylase-like protein
MPSISEIRQQYPQYQDLSDEQLVRGLHQKFYNDMDFAEFSGKIGLQASQPQKPEQPGVAGDVTKSIGSNLLGGAMDLGMTLPNLVNTAVAGPQLLGRGIADTVSPMLGAQPQPRGELWQPFYGSHDAEKAIGTGYEPKTTAGKVVALPSRIAGGIGGAKALQSAAPKAHALLDDATSGKPVIQKTTSDDIRMMANRAYQAADDTGGILKPDVTNKFIDEIEGLAPQTAQGKALAGDNALTKNTEILRTFRGQPITLKSAQEIDEILGDKIDEFVDKTTGAISKEGKKLLDVQNAFRKSMDNATEADVVGGNRGGFESWKQGKKLWSQAAKLRDVEKIIQRAEFTDNPATAIKTGFRNLYVNKARMRGFAPDEARLIKKAAETGVISDALRTFGSRLIPMGVAVSGGGLGATAAAQAGSMASRGAATKIQVNRAGRVADAIAANANKVAAPPNATPLPVSEGAFAPLLNQPSPRMVNSTPRLQAPTIDHVPLSPSQNGAPKPDLFSRVIQQESGGRQSAVSPKGAIGVAQIMPNTAPEAARAAGLPYDFNKLKTDPEYNAALGKAYLDKMLSKYGNETHALIAYNWGPGNTDRWLKRGGNLALLPKETRNYIRKILNA